MTSKAVTSIAGRLPFLIAAAPIFSYLLITQNPQYMFSYKDFYAALGNLFYAIAAADGKVQPHEKEQIEELVLYHWKHMEDSTDEFATDAANIILFQFDVNEANFREADEAYQAFAAFYSAYAGDINHYLREKIMSGARRVADSTRRINQPELHLLMKLKQLLDEPIPVI
jgi:uncharacterized tellurite resistance protein B-like protein